MKNPSEKKTRSRTDPDLHQRFTLPNTVLQSNQGTSHSTVTTVIWIQVQTQATARTFTGGMALQTGYELSQAQDSDIDSLTTIHQRIFHPGNPFQKKAIPDTAVVREFWKRSYERTIKNPGTPTLVVKHSSEKYKVIGCLRLKMMGAKERGCGFWTTDALSADHDMEICLSFIRPMSEYREKFLFERPHILIELFGIDAEYRGTGAGVALLRRCCQIADEKGVEVFVESNAAAEGFYRKYGFEAREVIVLPGGMDYREVMMVRPARESNV